MAKLHRLRSTVGANNHCMMYRTIPIAMAAVALLAGCAGQTLTTSEPFRQPSIVQVDTWGGTVGTLPAAPQKIHRVTLHHQGETWKAGADVAKYLQRLQQWSRLTKRWADIPYHYVIAPDGQIYAARDIALSGDTNTEYDPSGHALVMLMGNFEEVQPTAAQLDATVQLVAWLVQKHRLDLSAIASHRDFSGQTVCPGKNFYALLRSGWLHEAVSAALRGVPYVSPAELSINPGY